MATVPWHPLVSIDRCQWSVSEYQTSNQIADTARKPDARTSDNPRQTASVEFADQANPVATATALVDPAYPDPDWLY